MLFLLGANIAFAEGSVKSPLFHHLLRLSSSASRFDSGTGAAHFQVPDTAINVAK